MVVDPAVLPVVVPFVDEPVVVPLAAGAPAAELPLAEPVPLCVSSSARWNPPGCSHRRLYAAAIVSHRVSLRLELASDVAMSVEPAALHSLKWEAIST